MEYGKKKALESFYIGTQNHVGSRRSSSYDLLVENWIEILGLGGLLVAAEFNPITQSVVIYRSLQVLALLD